MPQRRQNLLGQRINASARLPAPRRPPVRVGYFGRSSYATWQPLHDGWTPSSQISSAGLMHSASGMPLSAPGRQTSSRHNQTTMMLSTIERTETTSRKSRPRSSSVQSGTRPPPMVSKPLRVALFDGCNVGGAAFYDERHPSSLIPDL
jgi:hypothetical protein